MTSKRELGFAILALVQREGKCNRYNLIGRGFQRSSLEHYLNLQKDDVDRTVAYRVFDELIAVGLLDQPRTDLAAPEDWVTISEAGKKALEQRALDDLDGALFSIEPRLVELREGMWASLRSVHADKNRQAAHSARELINQTLDAIAPALTTEKQTRKARVRIAMNLRGKNSDGDADLIEKIASCVDSLYSKLSAEAHSRTSDAERDIADLISLTELALRRVLL